MEVRTVELMTASDRNKENYHEKLKGMTRENWLDDMTMTRVMKTKGCVNHPLFSTLVMFVCIPMGFDGSNRPC